MAKVCVIGAGVAGLAAALRLRQDGHTVTVLEAKPRAGGLSTTLRHGDVITEVDRAGRRVNQTCMIDPGLYINAGPGRLPHHHRRILDLCRELDVALEPYIMTSDANYYVDADSGARFRRRRIENDARGHIAALAWSSQDPRQLRGLVRSFGDLTERGQYEGTARAGGGDPISVGDLAALGFQSHRFWQPLSYLWQDTMFQPVGGMDAIWRAMLDCIGDLVVYNAPVESINVGKRHVEVEWKRLGRSESQRFDWCLSSVPLPVLDDMPIDGISRDFQRAIATPRFAPTAKVGWQAESRWWESDSEQIYGGISYTNHPIEQFWYPSTGHHCDGPATLTGAYAAYGAAEKLVAGSVADRIDLARSGGALIHPEVADESLVPTGKAIAVAWHRVPYQAGGWCDWHPGKPGHDRAFARLQSPDGRFCMIGDQVSAWPGWQEGCLESVDRAIAFIDGRGPGPKAPEEVEVPDARWLTGGDHPWHQVMDEALE